MNYIEKEVDIQSAVCDYLALKGYFFWRNNNTPIYNPTSNSFRAMPKYALKGLPDIFVLTDGGYLVGLEIKTHKGKLSDNQKEIQKRFNDIGAEYYVIRSVDELIDLFI